VEKAGGINIKTVAGGRGEVPEKEVF